ncbi:trypsin-like cysteine/serine peptidase domain-containing protein [Penicillium brevicompactum]|uniref:Trypsin-like cysteine/serine peptidase domain-containing protein n=1 Tax=Penicillium brevicompactum TaxID=5074 RepID=A0A9W9R4K2_PENBR|nr:trypsin-like cysteine/serine peptidase domain-containing protein [Penicillium brevicompactum]
MKATQLLSNILCIASLTAQPVSAIVGGTAASADSAPFTVSIITKTWTGNTHSCGGSLISAKTVLTSAYCVDGSSASGLAVRVGSLERSSGGRVEQVKEVFLHPQYSSNSQDNDYAIIHLQNSVTDILPALISKEEPVSGAPLTLYGWGKTDKASQEDSKTLQQLHTTFINQSDCNELWSDTIVVTSDKNCDAAPEKNQGSCYRDQGGPVVNEFGEIVGLIGKYNYCQEDSNGRPDINAATIDEIQWIDDNTV